MNFELKKRTRRHPISAAQINVLKKLAAEGQCETSTATHHRWISGTAAAALERRNLVQRVMGADGGNVYEITAAGRKVIEQ